MGQRWGVNHGALEVLDARNAGGEPVGVAEVTGGEVDPLRPDHPFLLFDVIFSALSHRLTRRAALHPHRPEAGFGVELGFLYPRGEQQAIQEASILSDLTNVVADVRSAAQGAAVWPGLEREGEGGHIGIRADAGVGEGVPGSADVGVGIHCHPFPFWEALMDVVSQINSGIPAPTMFRSKGLSEELSSSLSWDP